MSKCYENYEKQAHNRYISHYFIIKASGAGIQSYYEFGVGIPFKKSLWKSIKNRMDFKKYYNVKSVLFLCYNVFRLGCVYCNSAICRKDSPRV